MCNKFIIRKTVHICTAYTSNKYSIPGLAAVYNQLVSDIDRSDVPPPRNCPRTSRPPLQHPNNPNNHSYPYPILNPRILSALLFNHFAIVLDEDPVCVARPKLVAIGTPLDAVSALPKWLVGRGASK